MLLYCWDTSCAIAQSVNIQTRHHALTTKKSKVKVMLGYIIVRSKA